MCTLFQVPSSLYRFQGSALSKELVYNITFFPICQHLFHLFFDFFLDFLQRRTYNKRVALFVRKIAVFTVCSYWVHSCFGRFGIAKGVGKSLLFVAAGADFSFFSQLFFDFRSFLFSHRVGLLTSRGFAVAPGLLRMSSPMKLICIET